MEKITIVLPSTLTVPDIKGGAIEGLLTSFINKNEIYKELEIDLIAHHLPGVDAYKSKYENVKFHYLKYPTILIRLESIIISLFKKNNKLSTYDRLILKKINELNNKKILFEGASDLAIIYKKKYPDSKIYFHVHADLNLLKSAEDLHIVNDFKVITVSNFIRGQRILENIKSTSIVNVPNCIDLDLFNLKNISESKEQICKKYNLPINKKIILYTGRLVQVKGVLELVRAFQNIQDDNLVLLIVGSRKFGEKRFIKNNFEKKLFSLMKLDNRIKHLGFINHNDLPYLYKISDIAVVPSIYNEACALTAIEAISTGVPLITTSNGGIPEQCVGTKSILLDSNDKFIEKLEKSLRLLISNVDLRSDISKSELDVRERFSFDNYYNNLCDVLKD